MAKYLKWDRFYDIPAKYLVSIGITFAMFGLIVIYIKERNFGISISSIGIAFISIGMGFHAYQLSKRSDERLSILERMNFYRVRGLLVERRLTLREKLQIIKNSLELENKKEEKDEKNSLLDWHINEYVIFYLYSIWVCLTYLQQIDELRDRLTLGQQEKVIHVVDNLYKDLFEGLIFLKSAFDPDFIIKGNYPGQIEKMYKIVSAFPKIEEDQERKERMIVLKRILTNKSPIIIQVQITKKKEEVIDRVSAEKQDQPKEIKKENTEKTSEKTGTKKRDKA